jgi:hypothetical protein
MITLLSTFCGQSLVRIIHNAVNDASLCHNNRIIYGDHPGGGLPVKLGLLSLDKSNQNP